MAFTEKIKLKAYKNSAFRCCICHDIAVDVHHIQPKYKDGPNSIENAAPLCSSCHDLFGDNPSKVKKIRQMRDHWWEIVKARNEYISKTGRFDESEYVEIDPKSRYILKNRGLIVYYTIMPKDIFKDAAQIIFSAVFNAQKKFPNQERYLFLDIEGHRNDEQGFDHDMFELQCHFNLNVILPYVTRIYSPLISVENKFPQINDIPEILDISTSIADIPKSVLRDNCT